MMPNFSKLPDRIIYDILRKVPDTATGRAPASENAILTIEDMKTFLKWVEIDPNMYTTYNELQFAFSEAVKQFNQVRPDNQPQTQNESNTMTELQNIVKRWQNDNSVMKRVWESQAIRLYQILLRQHPELQQIAISILPPELKEKNDKSDKMAGIKRLVKKYN